MLSRFTRYSYLLYVIFYRGSTYIEDCWGFISSLSAAAHPRRCVSAAVGVSGREHSALLPLQNQKRWVEIAIVS